MRLKMKCCCSNWNRSGEERGNLWYYVSRDPVINTDYIMSKTEVVIVVLGLTGCLLNQLTLRVVCCAMLTMSDTSCYFVEERLVASAWVHERQHTGKTMNQLVTAF